MGQDTVAELREALAVPAAITVGGRDLKVRPLLFGEFPDAIEKLVPAVDSALSQGLDLARYMLQAGLVKEGERIRLDAKTSRIIMLRSIPLVATVPAALRFLQWMCATCTEQPLEFVQKLQPDDGMKLCGTVIEVNHDFFVQRMWPTIRMLLNRIPGSLLKDAASAQSNSPSASPTSSSA